jgi:hypothetical protein
LTLFKKKRNCKYLIHEFEAFLAQEDFNYFLDFYYNLLDKTDDNQKDKLVSTDTEFFKKFYKFPQLVKFEINTRSLEMNRMIKIKEVETEKSIYYFRYENPLLAGRQRKGNFLISQILLEIFKIIFFIYSSLQFVSQ